VIPFIDLRAQYQSIKDEVLPAVARVLESGQYVLGEEVAAFEGEFAAYCGTKYAVAVNSGTSALHLALLAAGAGPGDEVITTPHTFVATVAAILYAGARPVLVDIDPTTYTIDPNRVEAAITPRTKVIMPVHLYGLMADMGAIGEIARRHGLTVIEDAAQAHGAEYKGQRAGTFGELGCFSFYPGKNLGACGEAGAVVTNDPEKARVLRLLRDWGAEKKYHHVLCGFNYRMEGIQGAILRIKLRHLPAWTEARCRHAAAYDRLLAGTGVGLASVPADRRHVYHIYPVFSPRRDALQRHLHERGVQTGIHYPIPVHAQQGYAHLGYGTGDFPHTETAAAQELSLPMFAELSEPALAAVAAAVCDFCPA